MWGCGKNTPQKNSNWLEKRVLYGPNSDLGTWIWELYRVVWLSFNISVFYLNCQESTVNLILPHGLMNGMLLAHLSKWNTLCGICKIIFTIDDLLYFWQLISVYWHDDRSRNRILTKKLMGMRNKTFPEYYRLNWRYYEVKMNLNCKYLGGHICIFIFITFWKESHSIKVKVIQILVLRKHNYQINWWQMLSSIWTPKSESWHQTNKGYPSIV